MQTPVLDGISRELGDGSTRRGFLRLLGSVGAVVAVAALGSSGQGESAAAKRRGRKRGKRSTQASELQQVEQNPLSPNDDVSTAAAASIPPNCIYVCCDGTCDSWKMCLKCVKWPKPSATTTISAA